MSIRTYSQLITINSFEGRFQYLQLKSGVGDSTFGFDRYLNQRFYTSREWRRAREQVIARDYGLDLGVEGFEIYDKVIVHHMNPMSVDEVQSGSDDILDPEFLITTTHLTHNAIHFGDERLLPRAPIERRPGDTTPWR